MVNHGRKRARIYEYLLARGEHLVKKDVDNLVQRFKSEGRGGIDDDDAVAQALAVFAAQDGNVVTVDETDAGHSGPIPIKFERAVNKKPKYVRLSVPILNETAFYLLPMKLLQKKCTTHTLQEMTDQVARSNPQDIIQIEGHEYHYAMLFLGIENAVTGRKMKTFTETIKAKAQMLKSCAETLFIPVNFGNTHWCGIIVDVKGNQVMYYDPMNQKSYNSVLDRMSWDLAETLSDAY
ncbi:uncharacterized protein PITG_10666 [Phytophthora infestans T30-4]|uniref:Ubiquitin-like protease family profile domain-containing protein n=1 Tax=Phytophthora infestans (strain T30-4) TaxID=403677 RepID=D0NGT4_PHYIT|nr:uncharacterized protein PITG_10666 [Phytophthora infestans T30-4]EEY58573.1 conserved hypothetical protein [Phytophthora infestans T30-4]|eukprot:XP_002901517.1 conserved hypothetical protein [Phytophthora infestans T30-4]